jgi:hypothetical protein
VTFNETELYWLWRETMNRLESYTKRVKEGRDVSAAHDFAGYVRWSGLVKLCKDNPQASPLPVDGHLLQGAAENLHALCTEFYKNQGRPKGLATSELHSLHEKLDLLAGHVSRLTAAPGVLVAQMPTEAPEAVGAGSHSPALRLVQGGAA